MEREDDVQLIRKVLSGDDAVFGILVEKYQKSVQALAWRKIQDFHYSDFKHIGRFFRVLRQE